MDWLHSPASILAATPILIFLLERLLEKLFSFVLPDAMARMGDDDRPAIQSIGKNQNVQAAVMTYANYAIGLQEIFRTCLIALLSLVISQYTCTGSIKIMTLPHLALISLLLLFMFYTLVRLWRRRIDPAAEGATNRYYYTALGFSIAVIILDRALANFPEFCLRS